MSESTAVAKTEKKSAIFAPEVESRIAENKARNAVAAAIRGTVWSKDLSYEQVRAVAEYCRANGLDPIRHVEVLGGRIYLTATLYEERAAPLLQRGTVSLAEPDIISADARLDALAATGDEWAKGEGTRRIRERIKWGVPEKAACAVVQRITLSSTGKTLVGVNWCGGGVRQRDPVGDAEPVKTAITRAARRAWKQVAEAVPQFGDQFSAMERAAEVAQREVVALQPEPEQPVIHGARRGLSLAAPKDGEDYYGPVADDVTTESADREPGEEG